MEESSTLDAGIRKKFAERICAIVAPGVVVCLVGLFFSIFPVFYPRRVFAPLLGLVALGVVYFLKRSGRPVKAVGAMVFFLTAILLAGVFLNGGVMAPAYVGLMLCLVVVAWFYGVKAVVAFALMVIGAGGATLILEHYGVLPELKPPSPFFYWAMYSLYYVAVALLLVLSYGMLREALRALEEREDLLSSIYASLDAPLLVVDSKGNVVEMNLKAMELSETLSREGYGKSVMDMEFDMDGERLGRLSDILGKDVGMLSGRRVRTRCGGQRRWFLLSSAPMPRGGGKGEFVVAMRDITEDVVREYHMEHSRKMEALGRLAGGIAHDFNNMLAAIMGAVEVVRSDNGIPREEMLDLIYKAARKAAGLTEELLVFSRKSPSGRTDIDIHKAIRETVLILSRTVDKKINIRMELAAEKALVSGDDALVHSSLMNIGINAAHAMPGGGVITFRTSNVEIESEGNEYPGFDVSPGKYLLVEVEDAGVGIPEEIVDRVFEPFFTTKKTGEGTGLGLYVVYGMARKHSGAIKVRNRRGGGTIFDLLFPLSSEKEEQKEAVGSRWTEGSGVVLVVDDEDLVRMAQARLLESLGYKVFVANGGVEALDVLEREKVDIVVFDLAMPGMSGEEFFLEMMEKGFDIPAIAISGHASDDSLSRMFKKGLSGFLQKPCERMKLAEAVADALEAKRKKG